MNKNWKAICQIPDAHMVRALALLDLNSDFGQKFVKQLPEYFTEEKQAGPYPLSFLKAKALEKMGGGRGAGAAEKAAKQMWSLCINDDFDIPVVIFANDPVCDRDDASPMPAEIASYTERSVGDIIEWSGKNFVVFEEECDAHWVLVLVPAECIAVDC